MAEFTPLAAQSRKAQRTRTKRGWLKLSTKLSGSIGLVGVVIGSFYYSDPNSPNWNPNDYAMYDIWAVAVAPLCVCFFVWVIAATNTWWHQVRIAITPLPTPAEIYTHLEIQYGRPPTVEELAAVQQLFCNGRNDAVINGGIGLALLTILSR